ncbi:hypothetical protein ACRQ5Q_41135 (plasmid) [Bradyrhizobium sp. PMVTL-01]
MAILLVRVFVFSWLGGRKGFGFLLWSICWIVAWVFAGIALKARGATASG